MLNRDILIGIYASALSPTPTPTSTPTPTPTSTPTPTPTITLPAKQLNNFSVTTSSGNILVNWGDITSETLTSGVSVNHAFICPNTTGATGFWNNIEPCI